MKESGGNFDVIIDDGGHMNYMIYQSFITLWEHALAPGGLYFIEDLLLSRMYATLERQNNLGGKYNGINMADIVQNWIEQLLTPLALQKIVPMPTGVKSITCIAGACVISKCEVNDRARCSQ